MTSIPLDRLRDMAHEAMRGFEHENAAMTLLNLGYMDGLQRWMAARCYAAIVGERMLPAREVRA